MSTYGAILGASIGVILLCLVVMVACYVLYAVSHMKALKALGYKNAWLAWIPYGVFYACADAAAEGEGEKVKLFGSLELPAMVFKLWWILPLALLFIPVNGTVENVITIVLNVVFLGCSYAKMYAKLEGKQEGDRYLKKIIAFSFKLDNGSAHNFIEKYASYMEMFDIKERDGLEEFLKEITANIDIRTQEKIFEKAENLHRLLATQEKMDSGILAFEILTLCIKEKLSVVDLRWIIDMSGYSNVENKIGKEYFNTIRERVKYIIKYSSTVNGKIVCKADSFIDRMIFIIAGLDNVYKNKVCAEFFCADEEVENDLIFSRKIYELLKI